jgi:hypothetical protein
MASKKIWTVFVASAPADPLTEVEASTERGALDAASAFYGVARDKLYALPTAAKKSPRKSKAQRDRERAEALEKSQRWLVMFQMPGSQWAYVARTGSGNTMDPDAAFDFGSRDAAESHAASMQGPRSSLRAKVTSRPKKIGE